MGLVRSGASAHSIRVLQIIMTFLLVGRNSGCDHYHDCNRSDAPTVQTTSGSACSGVSHSGTAMAGRSRVESQASYIGGAMALNFAAGASASDHANFDSP